MTKIIPYRGFILVKPIKNKPASRVVTLETVNADRSGNTKNMPGQKNQPNPIEDEMHFIMGDVIHVGLGYPEGSSIEKNIPGMEVDVPRTPMETQVGDRILYMFGNPLNPVFEIDFPDGTMHLMKEDCVVTIIRE